MRKVASVVGGLALVMVAAGCARHTSLRGSGPDEFAVARQAPLVIPPDFALAPPQAGAVRANDQSPSAQALDALFGGAAPRSASERATLDAAGANTSQLGIRSEAGDPGTTVTDRGTVTRDIVAAPVGDGQNARTATPGS